MNRFAVERVVEYRDIGASDQEWDARIVNSSQELPEPQAVVLEQVECGREAKTANRASNVQVQWHLRQVVRHLLRVR